MLFNQIKPYVRFAQNITVLPNAHYDFVHPCENRLFFGLEGTWYIQTLDSTYKMQKNSLIIIPAGKVYKITPWKTPFTIYSANFDFTYNNCSRSKPILSVHTKNFTKENLVEEVLIEDETFLNDYVYFNDSSVFESKLKKLVFEYSKKLIHYDLQLSSILMDILAEVVRQKKITVSYNTSLNEIFSYIQQNYNKKLTNGSLAKKFGYNSNYISNLFKSSTNLSLHQYIMNIRVNNSIKMLTTTNKSILEISYDCGFCDLYHYSKTFKKLTGFSPLNYKKHFSDISHL